MSASASLTDTNLAFTDTGANTGVIQFTSDEFSIDKAITLTSDLKLAGATSGNITINAADATTSYAIKLPDAQGSSDSVLTNDGAGNLTWGLGYQKLVWAIQGVINVPSTPTTPAIIQLAALYDGSNGPNYGGYFRKQEYNSSLRSFQLVTLPNEGLYQIQFSYIHPELPITGTGTQQSSGSQSRLYLSANGGNIFPLGQDETSGNTGYANQGTLTNYYLSGGVVRFYWSFQNSVSNQQYFISATISQWMI